MIEEFEEDGYDDSLKVVYVLFIGKDIKGMNIYHFLLSTNSEDTFAEGWAEKPACAEKREFMTPSEDMYEYVKELHTDIVLNLAQDSCEFTMQDARDHCISLAYENLDDAEEYPEDGRIVIQFGDCIDDVEYLLAKRKISLRFIEK